MKKILVFIFLIFSFVVSKSNSTENKIIFKVNNQIITSLDMIKESKYLILLNPGLKKLEKSKLEKLSSDSIINEKVKEIEINKYFKNERSLDDPNLKKIIQNLYNQIGLGSEAEFEKYLNLLNLNLQFIKEKIAIEMYWNNLIFRKYNNQVVIDNKTIELEIKNEIKKIKNIKEYNLSEILIRNEKDLDINKIYDEIIKSFKSIGFENTATLYSKSDTSKVGGKIGWIKETSLSQKINNNLNKLKKGEVSKPIKISNNFIIIKINDIKFKEKKIDVKKLLENRIAFEKNQQLERFSIAYLNKVKKNININEL